jgi:hypothetical protein
MTDQHPDESLPLVAMSQEQLQSYIEESMADLLQFAVPLFSFPQLKLLLRQAFYLQRLETTGLNPKLIERAAARSAVKTVPGYRTFGDKADALQMPTFTMQLFAYLQSRGTKGASRADVAAFHYGTVETSVKAWCERNDVQLGVVHEPNDYLDSLVVLGEVREIDGRFYAEDPGEDLRTRVRGLMQVEIVRANTQGISRDILFRQVGDLITIEEPLKVLSDTLAWLLHHGYCREVDGRYLCSSSTIDLVQDRPSPSVLRAILGTADDLAGRSVYGPHPHLHHVIRVPIRIPTDDNTWAASAADLKEALRRVTVAQDQSATEAGEEARLYRVVVGVGPKRTQEHRRRGQASRPPQLRTDDAVALDRSELARFVRGRIRRIISRSMPLFGVAELDNVLRTCIWRFTLDAGADPKKLRSIVAASFGLGVPGLTKLGEAYRAGPFDPTNLLRRLFAYVQEHGRAGVALDEASAHFWTVLLDPAPGQGEVAGPNDFADYVNALILFGDVRLDDGRLVALEPALDFVPLVMEEFLAALTHAGDDGLDLGQLARIYYGHTEAALRVGDAGLREGLNALVSRGMVEVADDVFRRVGSHGAAPPLRNSVARVNDVLLALDRIALTRLYGPRREDCRLYRYSYNIHKGDIERAHEPILDVINEWILRSNRMLKASGSTSRAGDLILVTGPDVGAGEG